MGVFTTTPAASKNKRKWRLLLIRVVFFSRPLCLFFVLLRPGFLLSRAACAW